MSILFPHPDYAEDQPLYRTILTTHVLYRGFQTGALVGSAVGASRYAYQSVFRKPASATVGVHTPPSVGSTATAAAAGARPLFLPTLLRSAGVGAAVGTGALAVTLVARMWGREEIEWRDRSWRLLENKGQKEVDSLSLVGALGGAAAVALGGVGNAGATAAKAGWRVVLGGAGLGSLLGVGAYMGWRYGVNGGKWPEEHPGPERGSGVGGGEGARLGKGEARMDVTVK